MAGRRRSRRNGRPKMVTITMTADDATLVVDALIDFEEDLQPYAGTGPQRSAMLRTAEKLNREIEKAYDGESRDWVT